MKQAIKPAAAWGDQGDGTYKNPVLFADYSDPDVIRVGTDYYMVCSEFHFMGIPLLHSKDLVNWRIINRIYDRLRPGTDYDRGRKYGMGSWAPSIRCHDGVFYVFFCTPDMGLFMTKTEDPAGQWSEPLLVREAFGWEDPCPFWDTDGKAYLGRSKCGAGPIIVHKMAPDGTALLDEGKEVYSGPVAEGTKFYAYHGYIYLVIPEGSVCTGWETALRSHSVYGPYERQIVLEQGADSWVNGPHQGALVDTPNGELWFLHFSETGVAGRICHLQPAQWVDGWPVIGKRVEGAYHGNPVMQWTKPETDFSCEPFAPQASDDFSGPELAPQWQWNHNPMDDRWSLTERRGWLRLKSTFVNGDITVTPNILTQKLMGACGNISVTLSTKHMADSQVAGLMLFGTESLYIGVVKMPGRLCIDAPSIGSRKRDLPFVEAEEILLRITVQYLAQPVFSYSLDKGKTFTYFQGGPLTKGVWKGTRVALFTRDGMGGSADFSHFTYVHDGPQG